METLSVWFYDPAGDKEGLVNRVVAYTDPPYCHCELQFPDSSACSIYMGSSVVMKQRTFDEEHYTAVRLSVPAHKCEKAKLLCQHKVSRNVRFSSWQMLSCVSAWRTPDDPNYTFCSKLIAGVLVDAGILPSATNCNVTPSALYRLLSNVVQKSRQPCEALEFCHGVECDMSI